MLGRQVEAHPYWRNDAMLALCKELGITVTAYSPLGGQFEVPGIPVLLKDPVLLEIAEKLHRTPAEVGMAGLDALQCRARILFIVVWPYYVGLN